MTQTKHSRMILVAVACVLAATLIALAGCSTSSTSSSEKTSAQLNREYMASVNSISSEAADDLSSFSEAIGTGDIATARIDADNAIATLSEIQDLEAPDALSEVDADYKKGAEELSEALSRYVDLYTKVYSSTSSSSSSDSSSDSSSVDIEAVSQELSEIQALYDDGIQHLSDADQLVSEMSAESEGESSQQNPLLGSSLGSSSDSSSDSSSSASSESTSSSESASSSESSSSAA
jgi:hypothetical protein